MQDRLFLIIGMSAFNQQNTQEPTDQNMWRKNLVNIK